MLSVNMGDLGGSIFMLHVSENVTLHVFVARKWDHGWIEEK